MHGGSVTAIHVACSSNSSAHSLNHRTATNLFKILMQFNIQIFSYYQSRI